MGDGEQDVRVRRRTLEPIKVIRRQIREWLSLMLAERHACDEVGRIRILCKLSQPANIGKLGPGQRQLVAQKARSHDCVAGGAMRVGASAARGRQRKLWRKVESIPERLIAVGRQVGHQVMS